MPQGDEAEVWHYSMDELYKKIKVTQDLTPINPESEFVKALRYKAGWIQWRAADFNVQEKSSAKLYQEESRLLALLVNKLGDPKVIFQGNSSP